MKHILSTTAVIMSLSGAAFAESHVTATDETDTMTETTETEANENTVINDNATTNTTTTNDATTNTVTTDTAMVEGIGMVKATPEDFYASDLIGMRIYNVENDLDTARPVVDGAEMEWDDIGEINDLIVTGEGKVSAVILGVGGFLGIGERDVSVSMDAITVLNEEGDSNDRFLVVKTSKEELENAPVFERDEM